MTLQLRLLALLAGLLVLLAGAGALWTKAYNAGRKDEAATVAAAHKKQEQANAAETARVQDAGYQLATDLLLKLSNREALLERTSKQLAEALALPAPCPDGGSVGDVVLPARLVDGMFNREPRAAGNAAGTRAPGPEPDAALRHP